MVTNCWTSRTVKVIIRQEILRRKKFMKIKNTHGDFTSTPRFNLNFVVIYFFFFGYLRRSSTVANSVFLILVINQALGATNCLLNKNSLTTIDLEKCLSIYFLMLDKFWLPVFKWQIEYLVNECISSLPGNCVKCAVSTYCFLWSVFQSI